MGHMVQLGSTLVATQKRRANRRDARPILHLPPASAKARLPVEETLAISRAAMCESKPAYPTAAKAWATVQHRNRRKHRDRSRTATLEPYRCPHCGSWHIGSRP